MATVKVSGLKAGPVLDWVVAKAIGEPVKLTMEFASKTDGSQSAGLVCWIPGARRPFKPSTDWAQGGPLLDSNPIVYRHYEDGRIEACLMAGSFNTSRRRIAQQMGATILEAACKSIVASVFTTVVEIPDELEN